MMEVTSDEIGAWLKLRTFQDITGRPNLRSFTSALLSAFGERELGVGALDLLYQRYPRIMKALEG